MFAGCSLSLRRMSMKSWGKPATFTFRPLNRTLQVRRCTRQQTVWSYRRRRRVKDELSGFQKWRESNFTIHRKIVECIFVNSALSTFVLAGCGVNDSPIGLAAYILEKFSTWTDKKNKDLMDGGLERYTHNCLCIHAGHHTGLNRRQLDCHFSKNSFRRQTQKRTWPFIQALGWW